MNTSLLFIGLLPLLIFVIVDSFAGLKSALITTVIVALVEVLFTIIYFGEIDSISLFSLFLVFFMAFLSYKKQSDLFIKFQPVALSAIFGLTFIVSFLISKPLFYEFTLKYKDFLPQQLKLQLENPFFITYLKTASWTLGLSFLLHGFFTAWAALKLSNWWWIAIRGIGFYVFMLLGILLAQFLNSPI